MSTKALSCSCCGNMMTFPEDVAVIECPACGTSCAAPRASGDMLLTLQRAVEQRLACDFHSAELSYQQVLLFHPDEHEALWGRLLCHYGVEYVEDPVSRRRMPTVRTVRPKPLQEQADFRKACEFAPAAVRAQYGQDARYIDDAQAEIRRLAVSCSACDVFLCHKTTMPGSRDYTQDFHRAADAFGAGGRGNGAKGSGANGCTDNRPPKSTPHADTGAEGRVRKACTPRQKPLPWNLPASSHSNSRILFPIGIR